MTNRFLEKQKEILKKAINSCTRGICCQTWKEEKGREKENENAGDE